MEIITLAGGCFWCTEAVFRELNGVTSVMPGYSGGTVDNPSYQEVSSGKTGHAESVQITFDSKILSLSDLLYVFFKLHDPTQINRQGADVGTQYRSSIFFASEAQKAAAEKAKGDAQKDHKDPVVTEITPYKNFFPAEESHRQYYLKNKGSLYCSLVIDPKITKLKNEFSQFVKK